MKRLLGCSMMWFVLAIGFAHAIPARPLYEPVEPAQLPVLVVANLHGSEWSGKYMAANRIFIFEADGTVSYKSSPKTIKGIRNRGTWKFDGKNLTFEHYIGNNNILMEFRGVIQDGNTIMGEATYKTGKKEQQSLQRINLNGK